MSKTETLIPLADGFTPAAEGEWRALVEKTLKGGAPESLVARVEGVDIAPLYTAATSPADPRPLARGPHAPERAFDLRAPVRASDREGARTAILEALENGASSVLIDLHGAADGPDALPAILDGVLTDVAPIALDAGERGIEAAEALSAAVKASPAAPLALHLDPFGAAGGGAKAELDAWVETAARLSALHPRASLFLASGASLHEAGAEPAFELAFALSSAVAYAKALANAGLSTAEAFKRVVLALAVDQKPLVGIAKLRAMRRLWSRVTEACGAQTPATIEARSSRRMLTIADPWSNLVRLTLAGFAGAVGGADAIVLYPHDVATGGQDPLGARYARNTGLVLMDESGLGRVIDPAAGAFAFEALTDQIARAAWSAFKDIERGGGAEAAVTSGLVAAKAEEGRAALKQALDDKRLKIVGVTDYRADPGGSAPSPTASDAGEKPGPAGAATFRLETLA